MPRLTKKQLDEVRYVSIDDFLILTILFFICYNIKKKRKAVMNMKNYFKWLIGASVMGFAIVLASCSETTQKPSASPQSTPSSAGQEPEQTYFSLRGFELKEDRKSVDGSSFNLGSNIDFYSVKSVDELQFTSSNDAIATVDNKGVITRVQYGNATITIAPKDAPNNIFRQATFNILFAPPESYILGKYDSHIDGVVGQPEVLVTIELKANKHFTITYEAGKVAVGEEQFDITAQTLEGTYTEDSLLKFTITSETTLKKTFSGMFVYDGDKVTIKAKVPVSADKTSRMIYLEGLK